MGTQSRLEIRIQKLLIAIILSHLDAHMSPVYFDVPGFCGQGIADSLSAVSSRHALSDLNHPHASSLLSQCHKAFIDELGSLSPEELAAINLDLQDFQDEKALIGVPIERYKRNSIIISTTLFLLQILRYSAFIHSSAEGPDSIAPYCDVLKNTIEAEAGILGLSSGLFPAAVAATSSTPETFVDRSVELFKLVLWIGYRLCVYRRTSLAEAGLGQDTAMSFGIVFVGLDFEAMSAFIKKFNSESNLPPVSMTTVLSNDLIMAVSGRPDVLKQSTSTVPSSSLVRAPVPLALDTLFHAPIHAEAGGTMAQVLDDIHRRSIKVPSYANIVTPFYSTITGDLITPSAPSHGHDTLAEALVDMVMARPTFWDLVVAKLGAAASAVAKKSGGEKVVRIVDVGPAQVVRGNSVVKQLNASVVLDLRKFEVIDKAVVLEYDV